MAYRVIIGWDARRHLRDHLTANRRAVVQDAIDQRLTHEAEREDTNRFRTRPNAPATWELRVGNERVYYDVEGDEVLVVAIGTKRGERLFIDGQEYSQ